MLQRHLQQIAEESLRTPWVVGGSARPVDLQPRTPTTSNAVEYARIVADYSAQRRLVGAGKLNKLTAESGVEFNPDVRNLSGRSEFTTEPLTTNSETT
jgi:replicative DNA helicase